MYIISLSGSTVVALQHFIATKLYLTNSSVCEGSVSCIPAWSFLGLHRSLGMSLSGLVSYG